MSKVKPKQSEGLDFFENTYLPTMSQIKDKISDDNFENYKLFRDQLISLIDEDFKYEKLLNFIEGAHKYKLADTGLIDNLFMSFDNKLNSASKDFNKKQKIIDSYICPSSQLKGWKHYDRYLSGYLSSCIITYYPHVPKNRIFYLVSRIFQISESIVKSSYNEVSDIDNSNQDITVSLVVCGLIFFRISMLCNDLNELKPRAKHTTSENTFNQAKLAYIATKKSLTFGVLNQMREQLNNPSLLLKHFFNEDFIEILKTQCLNPTPDSPHLLELDIAALSLIALMGELAEEALSSKKMLNFMIQNSR